MRDAEFKAWLERKNYAPNTIGTQMAQSRRIEQAYGDLDELFDKDRFASIFATFTYNTEDKRSGRPNPSRIAINGDVYTNLASYRASLNFYQRFRDDLASHQHGETDAANRRFDDGMERLKAKFLERMPDFESFDLEYGEFFETEQSYKMLARGDMILAAGPDVPDENAGRAVYKRLSQSSGQGLPLSWRTQGEVQKVAPELQRIFYETVHRLARLDADDVSGLEDAARTLEDLRAKGLSSLKRGEVLGISISIFGTRNPNAACWFKVRTFDRLAKQLLGKSLFNSSRFEISDFWEFQELLRSVESVLNTWGWKPEGLDDVQGFVWVALAESWGDEQSGELTRDAVEAAMDECEEIGVPAFLAKYGFGRPRDYWTRRNNNGPLFPAKATVGAAHGYMPGGKAQSAKELQGGFGEQAANTTLQRLGFEIVTEGGMAVATSSTPAAQKHMPVNLILYGPPGTGKTYATAEEAVRLCGEEVPSDRAELMAAYRRLSDAKRIEFVTFHQSMSYEEFVEGKQPVTGSDGEESTGGFRLETIPGTFRRIARRAETSISHSAGPNAMRVEGRQIFKTSIGEATNPEDAYLFEEAIAQGHTLLGFEDIDWSDDRFATRDAIIEACREHGDRDGDLNAQTGRVQMPFIFRNWVKPGDLIVVSKGNLLFRAIGEVTGEYEFHPRPEGGYAHRRKVKWLWVDRDGVSVSEIYQRKFSMRTIYLLTKEELNIPALERYMNSQQPSAQATPTPDDFVLIIDEINRANISKVFGELITLLEPDKRLGQLNELKVRLPYSQDEFGVPSNLHIIGTMNTADRSIALLDTALRRRFAFRELMPDASVLPADVAGVPLRDVLEVLNERIEYLFDREHQIGHAYFIGCATRDDIDDCMRDKVIPLLSEYFYEDWSKVAAVLGDSDGTRFLAKEELAAPDGLDLDGDAPSRWRWSVRAAFATDAYSAFV